VPSDVLHPRRPDEHFAAEADAARVAGLEVALVDHDALTRIDGVGQAACRLRQLREEEFAGGFVSRRFEHLVSAEVRTWWLDGIW
jgi:hypothetical protein